MSTIRRLTVLSILVLAVLLAVPSARACMSGQCCWTDGEIIICQPCDAANALPEGFAQIPTQTFVEFNSPTTASVTIQDFTTTALNPLTECVTAIAPIHGIAEVSGVTNYDGRTFSPFDEVTFSASEVASEGTGFAAVEDGFATDPQPWHGFVSNITGTVEDGVYNYFVVEVELERGMSPARFLKQLRDEGIFLTGSSTAGLPDDGHLHYRRLADTEIFVRYPVPFLNEEGPGKRPIGIPLP